MWLIFPISLGIIFLLDLMFTQTTFHYEPDYNTWKENNEPDY